MKRISVSMVSLVLMVSLVFSANVFAAAESAGTAGLGLITATVETSELKKDIGVEYRGHIQEIGNFPKNEKEWIKGPKELGTKGQSKRLEGFWIRLSGEVPTGLNIKYNVHVQNRGWMHDLDDYSTWPKNGDFAGTDGKSLQIEAICIVLVDQNDQRSKDYDVAYRGHVQNRGDLPKNDQDLPEGTKWYTNGQSLGTVGQFLRLEALEVEIVKKDADMTAYNDALAAVDLLDQAAYTSASWAGLQQVIDDNQISKDDRQADVDAASLAINEGIDALIKLLRMDLLTATSAKSLTIGLYQELASDGVVSVKHGGKSIEIQEIKYNQGRTELSLSFINNLPVGEIKVTVTAADQTVFDTVEIAEEHVESIEITSEIAILDKADKDKASLNYKVYNQYGQELTAHTSLIVAFSPMNKGASAKALQGIVLLDNKGLDFLVDASLRVSLLEPQTGLSTSKVVKIASSSRVETLTLEQPSLAVSGEDIKIPYTALNRQGEIVEDLSLLNEISFLISGATDGVTTLGPEDVRFEKKGITNYLIVDAKKLILSSATSSREVLLIATPLSQEVVQLRFTLNPNAKPTLISATDLKTSYDVDQSELLDPLKNVSYKDQYERKIVPVMGTLAGQYQLKVESSNQALIDTLDKALKSHDPLILDGNAQTSTDAAYLKAKAKGTANITLTLLDSSKTEISAFTYVANVLEKAE